MRKIECGVIDDLLPLYMDECCSEATRKLVEEHLKECKKCGALYSTYKEDFEEPVVETTEVEVAGIKKEYRRLKRWKKRGIVGAVVGVLLVLAVGNISINQIRGYGICYTNIGILMDVRQFNKAIEEGDYEKAYQYFDMEASYTDAIEEQNLVAIEEKGFEWYDQVCREAFVKKLKVLEAQGETITNLHKVYIERVEGNWQVGLLGTVESGVGFQMHISVTEDGIKPESFQGISPTLNEDVLKLLYEETDVDWETVLENESLRYYKNMH